MALKFKYKDEHGILQIDMSPTSSPGPDITDPKFDTINNRFGQYDIFGGKYDVESGDSLFRSRYNSVEEELANTPYAFATRRSVKLNTNSVDITVKPRCDSPSKDLEDDRFFKDLIGPVGELTVTRLSDVQDRYFDLSTCESRSEVNKSDGAFRVLADLRAAATAKALPLVPTAKRKREKSFAILTETPVASRPSSPRSLPVDLRQERVSPFRGRGFREETSRHNTPKTSATNSRANSPPRRRTNSLSRIDKMAQAATLPLPVQLTRPHSPRNFLKENIEEVREISELNREKHEAEAEKKRIEEEEALLIEMGLIDKKSLRSRSSSRSNSPSKIKLRSRSNSPSAILHFENIPANSKEFINTEDGLPKPVTHRSRLRSVSRSQPQSNDGSPKHSKIPKRQSSVSPTRRDITISRRPLENGLNKNQRFISNSTSSIHETIRVGSQAHDKRGMSKSTQHLSISPALIKGKPPISPGRGGPPPSNKTINSKRLSPIVGTPNKSPDDLKPSSAKTSTKPSPIPRKNVKTAGNTPATSRLNSRQPSRAISREPSPDKRTTKTPVSKTNQTKPTSRTPTTKTPSKPPASTKPEPKKPISRTNSIKSLTRTPSTKTLNEKPPIMKKTNSKKDLTEKSQSTNKINEVGTKKEPAKDLKKKDSVKDKSDSIKDKKRVVRTTSNTTETDEIVKQDNETQYDKVTNEKGELVIMTKKNVVSMTTAAITSQPLEVVTTVTNQLPAALEKAREKGIFERLSSKDSLVAKEEDKPKEPAKPEKPVKTEVKESKPEKETHQERLKEKEREKHEEKRPPPKPAKNNYDKPLFNEDHIRLKPLQPPYNNPQVERVKQKIDDILKEPEISTENILTSSAKSREVKNTFKNVAEKTKSDIKDAKDEASAKLIDLKDQVVKQNEKMVSEIRSEASKIVDSIITPVEEPKEVTEKVKAEVKEIEPIVMVVNEKKDKQTVEKDKAEIVQTEIVEKVNETLVKGDADVEVQSSNMSTPPTDKLTVEHKMAEDESDKSAQSNGGFPQSTSTTPKPPARTRKDVKKSQGTEETEHTGNAENPDRPEDADNAEPAKQPNLCQRLMGKCKTKCCPCCIKGATDESAEGEEAPKDEEQKTPKKMGIMDKMNCCKRKKEEEETIRDLERAAGKASIEFESETKRKRKLRDVLCGCCGRRRRVSDTSVSQSVAEAMSPANVPLSPTVVADTGCCGRRKNQTERRDSILSDRPPNNCCNRMCMWFRGMCRRHSEHSSSRRTSEFSKNKSLSPTLPPEDTRKKLDTSLVEHTSVMRGAIPILPIALAYFCLFCNVLVPGLGTIFSGMFCLCFGIPRFGVHDGAKHRFGSFMINLVVGAGQLFTVLFCLVGWGWSVWWGVIMVKTARKYRKLKAEEALQEAEAPPPITANNHTRA